MFNFFSKTYTPVAPKKTRYESLLAHEVAAVCKDIQGFIKKHSLKKDPAFSEIISAMGRISKEACGHELNLTALKTDGFYAAIDQLNAVLLKYKNSYKDRNIFTQTIWFAIHDLLLMRMHIKTAYQCRLNATACLKQELAEGLDKLDPAHICETDFINYMSYLAEGNNQADYESLIKLYKKLPAELIRSTRPSVRGMTFSFGHKDKYIKDSSVTIRNNDDEDYATFLKGKSIAIVGPVDVGLTSGEEIEKHDIVIRFNHHDKAKYDIKTHGERTDISYFTNPAFKKLVSIPDCTLHDITYALPQNIDELELEKKKTPLACIIRSQYRASNRIFFKSNGNAVQRMLLDLMRFEVGPVKLFNMNMWLTPHSKNYSARRRSLDPHTFIHHDMINNFCLLKNAVQNNVISADSVLSDILSLSEEEYINQLHERYAPAAAE